MCLLHIEFHQPFSVCFHHTNIEHSMKNGSTYRMLKVKLLNKQGHFHGADEISQAATTPQQWITTNRWTKEINSILFWKIFTDLRLVILLFIFSELVYDVCYCLCACGSSTDRYFSTIAYCLFYQLNTRKCYYFNVPCRLCVWHFRFVLHFHIAILIKTSRCFQMNYVLLFFSGILRFCVKKKPLNICKILLWSDKNVIFVQNDK